MKFSKIAMAAVLAGGLFVTTASADYNTGVRVYYKYMERYTHLSAMKFYILLDIKSTNDINALFKDNGKLLIEKLKAKGNNKAIIGLKKIIDSGHLKDLKDLFLGILYGKVPPQYP